MLFQVMLSSRLGVLGRLVANNVEEAKEAGAESVHPQMKSHVRMIPQRMKTAIQHPAQNVRKLVLFAFHSIRNVIYYNILIQL